MCVKPHCFLFEVVLRRIERDNGRTEILTNQMDPALLHTLVV